MSGNNNRSAPTSPGHQQPEQQRQQASSTDRSTASNNHQHHQTNTSQQNCHGSKNSSSLFGSSTSGPGGGGPFDFSQISQNISNSFHDIANIFHGDPLMDVRKMLTKTCNSCGISFSVFLRKKRCQNCYLHYCSTCMDQSRHRCRRCLIFAQLPLTKDALNTLRARDLKWFLSSRNINSETYSEKRELIDLILITVNGPSRRNSSSSGGSEVPRPSAPSSPPVPPTQAPTLGLYPQIPPPCSPTTSATSTPRHPNEPSRSDDAKIAAASKANLNISTFNLNDIRDETEIKDLSIRQLKLLLTRNFVDFKGCVEREELIQKAVLLWNDKQVSNKFKDDNEDSTVLDENACKICMENAIDCVLLECGHMLTCTDCGKILSECPVCRQFVTRVVHVFKG